MHPSNSALPAPKRPSAYAERVLGDSLRTSKELEAMRAGSLGLLRVGVLRAVAPVLVPHAILRCRQEAPRLQIRLYEDSCIACCPRCAGMSSMRDRAPARRGPRAGFQSRRSTRIR